MYVAVYAIIILALVIKIDFQLGIINAWSYCNKVDRCRRDLNVQVRFADVQMSKRN